MWPCPSWSVFDDATRMCRPTPGLCWMSPMRRAASSLRRNAPANPSSSRAESRRSTTRAVQVPALARIGGEDAGDVVEQQRRHPSGGAVPVSGVVAAQRREGGADQLGATGFPDRPGDATPPLPHRRRPGRGRRGRGGRSRWRRPTGSASRWRSGARRSRCGPGLVLQVGGDRGRRGGQRGVPVLGAPGGEAGPVLAVVAGGVRRHRRRPAVRRRPRPATASSPHRRVERTGAARPEEVEVVDGGHRAPPPLAVSRHATAAIRHFRW